VNDQISSLERQIREETGLLRSAQAPGIIDLQHTVRHRHWLGHLHRNSLEAEARLRFLEARLSQERSALAEAVKQRRILDKLKERQEQNHLNEEERRSVKAFDEMATVRYVFNKNENIRAETVRERSVEQALNQS